MARAIDWTHYGTLKAQGLADREIARQWGIPWGTFHREKQKREASLPVQTPPVPHRTPRCPKGCLIGCLVGCPKGCLRAPREKTERWNLHLPLDLITQTKAKAQALGVHPSELVAEVLRRWLAEGEVMREGSPIERFNEGVSRDLQRMTNKLWPLGPRALQARSNISKVGFTPAFVVLVALLLIFSFWKLPQWYATSWERLTDAKDIARLESDTRATMVQAVGGLALLAGLLFTWRNLRMTEQNPRQTLDLSRKGRINDRFIKAIEQLGAVDQGGRKRQEIRLGGIYALEQIAKDSPDDHHWPVMEVLTAYVRENAPWKEEDQNNQSLRGIRPKLAPDIQAILTVIGRRTRTYEKGEDQPLNLTYTDLRGHIFWRLI
jgi:hypothetical protein